jgi:streptogramin lyase
MLLNLLTAWHCLGATALAAAPGVFEDLGIPVRYIQFGYQGLGPSFNEGSDAAYLIGGQAGNPYVALCVDLQTGETRHWGGPDPETMYPKGCVFGPDGRLYMGTAEKGQLHRLDARQGRLENLGVAIPGETYLLDVAASQEGIIYGGTYPGTKLFAYEIATGTFRDLGRMDPEEMYASSVEVYDDPVQGPKVYVGVGAAHTGLWVYTVRTGEKKMIWPEERIPGGSHVETLADGRVHAYSYKSGTWYRIVEDRLEPHTRESHPGWSPGRTKDRELVRYDGERTLTVLSPDGQQTVREYTFSCEGAGTHLFSLGVGPDGGLYGSTYMPLRLFRYRPATGQSEDLGSPHLIAGGEIYSLLAHEGKLYTAAYGDAELSVYDPTRPWRKGREPDSNPRVIGVLGDGQDRPGRMVVGPDQKIYVASLPDYGEYGGAISRYDPATDKIQVFRNLIPQQGIWTIALTPQGLLAGGSSIYGGGGTQPVAEAAVLFLWDPQREEVVWQQALEPTVKMIQALAVGPEGWVWAAAENHLWALDPATRQVVYQADLPFGNILNNALLAGPDGALLGLAGATVFRLEPGTHELTALGEYPGAGTNCVVLDGSLYFGAGTHLVRLRLPTPAA